MELNVDQLRIVNNRPNGHMLIKGVAGSGKTTVAVAKIPMLIRQYMESSDKILFVTYNKTLINYTEYLLNDIDTDQNIFFSFDRQKQLLVKTIDSIIYSLNLKLSPKRELQYDGPKNGYLLKNLFLQAMSAVREKYPELTLIADSNYTFINEEVDWLKSCRYTERETYLNIDRHGRMSSGNNRYRLAKNSSERNAIFDIFITYEALLEKNNVTDGKTAALLVLDALNNGTLKTDTYRHIIVDESQDLTRVQLEILKHLYASETSDSCIMFIADVAQSIYTQSWLSNQSFKSIGFDMSGKSNILSRNYRTTYEIAQAAYSLIEKDETIADSDIFVKPVAIERHGSAPFYKHYATITDEATAIAGQIKKLSSKYSLKDIVITAANNNYLSQLKDILIREGIRCEIFRRDSINFNAEVVRLYTLHSIKGLEFPVLFIAGISEHVLPYSEEQLQIGRKLLYVGMTRARNLLYLSSAMKPSVYMNEIDLSLLLCTDTNLSPVYKVPVDEYRFTDKIKDINSNEEIVRQWFINELIGRFDYPENTITIEYPVQSYSKRGFADIAVLLPKNGIVRPYMLIETKQPGEDLDRAFKQLLDYSSSCPEAEYLVVTDGFNTNMFRTGHLGLEPVMTLPSYIHNAEKSYKTYHYLSYPHKYSYSYELNTEDASDIIIKEAGLFTNHSSVNNTPNQPEEALYCNHYDELAILGEVAAGNLKYANEEFLGSFLFPDLFNISSKDCFLLKVNGDSMINFGIDNGDHVVIRRQSHALNGDIVVAGKTGTDEVTLKQYTNFSGIIGLTPGNAKYEPIMIPEQELFINGILVGVLKEG